MTASRKCCADVLVANSARMFRTPAPILRSRAARDVLQPGQRVVEYGAGCLRNARYLQRLELAVTVIELPEVRDRFPRQYRQFLNRGGRFVSLGLSAKPSDGGRGYDVAVVTYVIETICQPALRERLLKDCLRRLRRGGTLLLSVRGISDVVTARAKGVPCSDGYVTPHRTFVRPFDRLGLSRLLSRAGFHRLTFLHRPHTPFPELIHVLARP